MGIGQTSRLHDIGWAIEQLRDGDRVRRKGWNGKGNSPTKIQR
jgi:hypothetical protein